MFFFFLCCFRDRSLPATRNVHAGNNTTRTTTNTTTQSRFGWLLLSTPAYSNLFAYFFITSHLLEPSVSSQAKSSQVKSSQTKSVTNISHPRFQQKNKKKSTETKQNNDLILKNKEERNKEEEKRWRLVAHLKILMKLVFFRP